MGFGEAIGSGFRNYANFRGRASRSEYWWWTLFVFLSSIIAALIDGAANIVLFYPLAGLLFFLPGVAVAVRRLHDTDRSGWMYLIALTVIGAIFLLVWFCSRGTDGPNRFGESISSSNTDRPIGASSYDNIDRLARLRDSGALTQEEFDREKGRILTVRK